MVAEPMMIQMNDICIPKQVKDIDYLFIINQFINRNTNLVNEYFTI